MTTRKRHVPLRTCVICGNKTAKKELIRIVATPRGTVEMDVGGKAAGRGTYVCKDSRCVQQGLSKRRLEFTLRTRVDDSDWAKVVGSVEALRTPD